jgi:hypothetical protein
MFLSYSPWAPYIALKKNILPTFSRPRAQFKRRFYDQQKKPGEGIFKRQKKLGGGIFRQQKS